MTDAHHPDNRPPVKFRPGDRVRLVKGSSGYNTYKAEWRDKLVGTVKRRLGGGSGCWHVAWDESPFGEAVIYSGFLELVK